MPAYKSDSLYVSMMASRTAVDGETRRTLMVLSAVLIDATRATEREIQYINVTAPTSGSVLSRIFEAAGEADAPTHVIDATLLAEYAVISACDHARAFAALLRTPRLPGTAIVTLTRAALESLARARWVAQDLDLGTLIHRTLSLLHGDLRYPENFGEQLTTRDGRPVNPAEKRAEFRAELARLGLPAPSKVEITSLVSEMVAQDIAHQEAKQLYSLLSSVAHGHRDGINAFITTSPDSDVLGMAARIPVVTELATQLGVTLLQTAEALLDWYGAAQSEFDRLDGAKQRLATRLSALPDVAFAPD